MLSATLKQSSPSKNVSKRRHKIRCKQKKILPNILRQFFASFKAAVYRIISQSPLFVLCSTKNRRLQKYNKMHLNVCVNEIASFGPFAAIVKGEMTFDID